MGKDKLRRFHINDKLPNVYQCEDYIKRTLKRSEGEELDMRGKWKEHFQNNKPITLELACGKGHYTVGLGRLFPERNFIGMDIKGARFFIGASTAYEEELDNVAFLRAHIEHIESFFAPGEISEIWMTFPDPQKEARRERKRLTHQRYLETYARLLKAGGYFNLKTDSESFYEFTKQVIGKLGITAEIDEANIDEWPGYNQVMAIRTDYEMKHRDLGATIKYLRFQIPENWREELIHKESAFKAPIGE